LIGDSQQLLARALVLRADPGPDRFLQRRVLDQPGVAFADRHVGLRQGHLGVAEQRREERPVAVHLLQHLDPRLVAPLHECAP